MRTQAAPDGTTSANLTEEQFEISFVYDQGGRSMNALHGGCMVCFQSKEGVRQEGRWPSGEPRPALSLWEAQSL